VVVAIVLAVVALVKGSGIDQVIIDAIKTAIESING